MDFPQKRQRFLSRSVWFSGKKLFCENFKSGLDSHDKLWYPVVTARLVKSNQSCEARCKELRFLHSILSFSFGRVQLLVCSASSARQKRLWYGSFCENRKQKRDMSLDHRRAPIFVFMAVIFERPAHPDASARTKTPQRRNRTRNSSWRCGRASGCSWLRRWS